MQKYLRPVLIGLAVFVVLLFLLGSLTGWDLTTWWVSIFIGLFTGYILANLAGNRKVAGASGAEKDAALKLTPPPGQALLVVYREGYIAKLAGLNLSLDGHEFVQLTAPKFTTLALSPGPHALVGAFGGFAGSQSNAAAFEFSVVEGAVTVIRINARMGAVKGAVRFTVEPDLDAARAKLARMPMAVATPA